MGERSEVVENDGGGILKGRRKLFTIRALDRDMALSENVLFGHVHPVA
jgi:hypothetical protein